MKWTVGCVLGLGLIWAASAQAGLYTNSFNSATSTNGLDFGGTLWDAATLSHTGSAAWIPTGGAGAVGDTTNGPAAGVAGDGFLQMTFAAPACGVAPTAFSSYLCGGILFPDIDPGEFVVGFIIECDLRIGDGSPHPDGGLSINFARLTDPVLVALNAGDTFAQMNGAVSPNGGQFSDDGSSTNISLIEDGTTTGLSFGFHASDGGDYTVPPVLPAVGVEAAGITHDGIGMDIRLDGVLLATIPMPNGTTQATADEHGNPLAAGDPNGNNAAADATAIETGPYDGTGCDTNLSWCHLKLDLDANDGRLDVWWKNKQIVTNLAVTYLPGPGRLLMAARVGGNTANIDVDNVSITTVAYEYPTLPPIPAVTPIGVSVQVLDDGFHKFDTNTIILTVNGNTVTPTLVSQVGSVITIAWWDANTPLAPGSTVTVGLSIYDTAAEGPYTLTYAPITVANYLVLTPSMAVTNVDTTQPGFNVKGYQVPLNPFSSSYVLSGTTPTETTMENSVRRGEEELAGLLGANTLSPSVQAVPGTINFNINTNTQEGDFTSANGYPDVPFPGLPNTATDEEQIDNFAYEFTTIIYFPETGVYQITLNSDDGFRMTAGNPAKDVFNSLLIGQYDGGRGSSDSTAEIYVQKAGYYPFRTMYFNGNGGANAEWSGHELYPTVTTNTLINDIASPTALLSYRTAASSHPAAVAFTDPVINSGTYTPNWPMEVQITDGSDGAISAPTLYLNGTAVTASTSKSGTTTTLSYTPTAMLASGSANMMGISFKDGSGTLHSNAVPFNVVSYTVVPPSMALTPANVDTSLSGFDIYTYKYEGFVGSSTEYGLQNGVLVSEMENHGFLGWPNAADLTVNWQFTGPGNTNYVESKVINYNGASGQNGEFFEAGGAGMNMPGIPPTIWPTYDGSTTNVSDDNGPGQNDYSLEIKTVIYLKAGFHTMNVESDDGFSVSVGNPAEWRTQRLVLGDYDGGRGTGVGGTAFNFYIATAGYYPFTCLYYEGGGGNAVEWYTTAAYPANNIYCLLNDPTAAYNTPTNSVNPALQCYEYPFGKTKGSPYIASYGPSMFRGYDGTAGTSHSTHTGYDAPIWVNLVDGDNAITTSSIGLTVNGTKVTPTVVKSGSNTSVTYTNAFNWVPGTTNTVSLTFLDRTATWSFMVENHKNPTFFIEAEDFDSGGKGLPVASIMPYWGGAYVGLPATLNVDYYEPAGQNNGPWYRVSNNASVASAAPLDPNVPMQVNGDMDRGVNELQSNYRIGWIGANQWFNYTRNFPAGNYNVYAGISNGGGAGTGDYSRYGVLQMVTASSTNNLGIFGVGTNGYATGTWGNNGGVGQPGGMGLVPLTDPNGNMLSIALSGTTTLRYWLPAATTNTVPVAGMQTTLQNGSGDYDFILFAPASAVVAKPSLSIGWVEGKAVISYQGTLSSASVVDGTYADVAGATSPYTVPAGTKTTFFRAHL